MNKIKILMFLVVSLLSCRLYAYDSSLIISLYDDDMFTIALDNIEYNQAGNIAEFEGLQPGEHYLRVVKATAKVPAKSDILFEGKIKIPSATNVYAVIDEYNAFTIYKKVPSERGKSRLTGDYYKYCGNPGNNEHHNENQNVSDECKYKAMNAEDYKKFKKSIGSRNFESSNVTITKEMLDKNTVTAAMVHEILGFFTFESTKLEIAKYAYDHTCDKKNYTVVNDAFTFDSSIDELSSYIKGK